MGPRVALDFAAVALAACGSSSSGESTGTSTPGSSGSASANGSGGSSSSTVATIDGQRISPDAKLVAMVPSKVKKTGLLDITYNNARPDEAGAGLRRHDDARGHPRDVFARDVADRVIFMDGSVIVEQRPPSEILTAPAQERTKRFLSRLL